MANPFTYKNLLFPLGGLDRKTAYQSQPPYTTMDALNVRPYRMESRRMSGGSRPGLAKWDETDLGNKVNMLVLARGRQVKRREGSTGVGDGVTDSNVTPDSIRDDFEGSVLRSKWEAFGDVPLPYVDANPPNGRFASPVAAVWKPLTVVDMTRRIQARMLVGGVLGASSPNGTYTLFLGLANSSPSASDGIEATLTIGDSGVSLAVKANGTQAYSGSIEDGAASGMLDIRLEADGSWAVSYCNRQVATGSGATVAGPRFGFMLEAAEEGCVAAIDSIEYTYFPDVSAWAGQDGEGDPGGFLYVDNFSEFPVAADGGNLYEAQVTEKGGCNGWLPAGNTVKVQQEGYVMAQQRLRDLFIADCGAYKASGTDGTIAVSSGTATLSATAISDWTARGIVAGSDVVLISDAATGVVEGEYVVGTVATAGITLTGYNGETGGTCTYQVAVSPKVYRHDEGNSLEPFVAEVGSVPVNCPLICLYRDRIVLAGAPTEPHLWYMSRQGDPYDWNYTEDLESNETDYGIAVAGSNADAGVIGQPIRALVPHSDDYLVFGYDSQLWIMRGDPASGGQLDCISRTVGIIGKMAWCYGPQGEIYFLSYNGLHRLAAGGSFLPQMVSYPRIPVELTRYTYADNVQLAYDRDNVGIHIFVEGEETGWFFSVENESFWPVRFASGADVTALCEYGNRVLFGCADGYVRVHDDRSVLDDSSPFTSYVVMGPVRLGRDDYGRGVLQRLETTMCGSRDAVGMQLGFVFADEPIQAAQMYGMDDYALRVSLQKPVANLITRRGSGCMLIKVGLTEQAQADAASWWGMERLGAYIKATGRFRE